MDSQPRQGFWHRLAPGLFLVFLAPMIAEVLPGATRMSSIFVFPVEMGVWGVGALLIRAAVRKWNLGWRNMLALAFALVFAEECLIQQTSLAPLVIQLVKGGDYARDFGINWLYLIWAMGYESALVVLLPVMLAELVFPTRRAETWVSPIGVAISTLYFGVACFGAWFTWTQIARTKVFHLPPYTPPMTYMIAAAGAILLLILLALGPARRLLARPSRPLTPPHPFWAAALAFVVAVLWYALILLAFRLKPDVPPLPAAIAGVILAVIAGALLARWSAHEEWSVWHRYAVVCGGMAGSMGVGFVGFIGATPLDFWGKTVLNAIAVVLLLVLARKITTARRSPAAPA